MIEVVGFEFVAPYWLLLIPLAWLLAWRLASSASGESAWYQVCDARLLALLGNNASGPDAGRWLSGLLGLALTLGLLAAAGPGWRADDSPTLRSAAARVILLDLSRAMLVQDLLPSRFAHARAAAGEIISAEFDGETGLVVYAGAAFTVAPLTRDSSTLGAFLDALEPGVMPVDGALIQPALARALELLDTSVTGRGQIVILATGVDDGAAAIESARLAAQAGQQVSVMAFGSAAGGPRIGLDGALERDQQGGYRLARTDLQALNQIAVAGAGKFIPAGAGDNIEGLLDTSLDARSLIESDAPLDSKTGKIANQGYWLLWMLLPLIVFMFRPNLVYGLLLALLILPHDDALAVDWSDPWRHAEQRAWAAYNRNDFELAGSLSSAPLLKGAAQYRGGNMAQALQAFADQDSAAAHFNRGNSLVQLEQYDAAQGAYLLALERQPEHRAARYNLRLVKLYLESRPNGAKEDPGEGNNDGELEQSADPARSGQGRQALVSQDDATGVDGGDGASDTMGNVNPLERYSGDESPTEQGRPAETPDAAAQAEVAEWISTLPAAASDLFKRKFLRDYRRAQQGAR